MNEALKKFANHLRKRGSSEYTIYDYTRCIHKIVDDLGKDWLEIEGVEIEDLVFSRSCKISTKQKYLAYIRSFLNFCYKTKLISHSGLEIFLPKVPKTEAPYLRDEQVKKLLSFPMDNAMKVAIVLMLSTGMRISEALSLKKQKLKKAEVIHGMYQLPILGKGKKLRSVFIPKEVGDFCLQYAESHKKDQILDYSYWKIQQKITQISKKL